jgi:hypothetical protein
MGISRISDITGERYDDIRKALDYYKIPINKVKVRPVKTKIKKTKPCRDSYYDSPYPIDFNENLREMIRERDGRKCRMCDKTEQELNRKCDIHHIDANKYNNTKENLISYCARCHRTITDHRRKYDLQRI